MARTNTDSWKNAEEFHKEWTQARARLEEFLADRPSWLQRYAGSSRDDRMDAYIAIVSGSDVELIAEAYFGD